MTDDSDTCQTGKPRRTPATPICKMTTEYIKLRDEVAQLMARAEAQRYDGDREEELETTIGAAMDRMSSLTMKIASRPSGRPRDLAHKARVVLDWIDEDGDISMILVASLCGDIVAMFSSDR